MSALDTIMCSLACAAIFAISYVVSMWIIDHTRWR